MVIADLARLQIDDQGFRICQRPFWKIPQVSQVKVPGWGVRCRKWQAVLAKSGIFD